MMIGELNYNGIYHYFYGIISIFFTDIFDGKTAYQAYTAIHFIFFVFVMTIISMNLTTGLAITNLAKIVENAEYTKLALQEV